VVGNHAPIVNSITANPTSVTTSGTVTITVDATDEDPDDVLTYVYSYTGGTVSGTGNTVTWIAPNTAGEYTITVYVNDGEVDSNSKSVSVTVTSPEKEKPKGFIPGFETFLLLIVLTGYATVGIKRKKRKTQSPQPPSQESPLRQKPTKEGGVHPATIGHMAQREMGVEIRKL
jgi:hypothetical protein